MNDESANPNAKAAETIFNAALAFNAAERPIYLAGACGDNLALRQRVEALLHAHEASPGFLPEQPPSAPPTIKLEFPNEEGPGTRIGRYKLLEKIGEGGMGVVYLAEQEEPVRRRVALKIIKQGMDTRQVIARFEAERQALALMDHPSIAKVFDAGATETGRPYFVMELVQGIPITEFCDKNKLAARERLKLFVQVCHAIQSAHQKGIIHRDIKPSNVLVTLHYGEALPKVIDFGVAKATNQRLTEKTLFTSHGAMIGTPAYMSPEQAELSSLDVDTRADVYSLGAMLYELLTGSTPFPEKRLRQMAYLELQRLIAEEEPERPSTRLGTLDREEKTAVMKKRAEDWSLLQKLLKGELDWIIMKCLEKDRRRRYETANGLAADLLRHLANEPVLARPPSPAYRLQKFVSRNKLAVACGGAIALILVIGFVVANFAFMKERVAHGQAAAAEKEQFRLRQEAERARANEAAASEKARQQSIQLAETLSRNEQKTINDTLASQGLAKGLPYLARALRRNPDDHRAALRLLSLLSTHSVARPLAQRVFPGTVLNIGYVPWGPLVLTTTDQRDLWLWDFRHERPLAGPLHHDADVTQAALTPSGNGFLIRLANGTMEFWNTINTAAAASRFQPGRFAAPAALSADESRLLTCAPAESGDPHTTSLRVWDLRSGQPVTGSIQYASEVTFPLGLLFTRDGKQVFIQEPGQSQSTWCLLDIATGNLSPKQLQNRYAVGSLDQKESLPELAPLWRPSSVQSRFLGAEAYPGQLLLPATEIGQPGLDANRPRLSVADQSLSPDSQELLATLSDGTVALWDVSLHRIIPTRVPAALAPQSGSYDFIPRSPFLDLSADGRRLLTVDFAGKVQVWDALAGRLMGGPLSDPRTLARARLSPNGQLLALAQTNGWLRLWDLAGSRDVLPPFRDGPAPAAPREGCVISWLSFSRNGQRLAAGWNDGTAQLWDASTGRLVVQFTAHQGQVTVMLLSPDSQSLATLGEDGLACVWDATTGKARIPPIKMEGKITSLEFSLDAKSLATGSPNRTAQIWDLQTGQALLPPLQHDGPVTDVSFLADDSLITFSRGGTLNQCVAQVWDPHSGTVRQTLTTEGNSGLQPARVSRDGRLLLAKNFAHTAQLWDPDTGTPLTELVQVESYLNAMQGEDLMAWSSDGQVLALPAEDGVCVWEFPRLTGPAPDWLPALVDALTGQRLDEQDIIEPIPPREYLALRSRILAAPGQDAFLDWARWFLADRKTLTLSPFSSATRDDYVRERIKANTVSSLQEAMRLDPANLSILAAYLKLTGHAFLTEDESLSSRSRLPEANRKRLVFDRARSILDSADRVLAAFPDNSAVWHLKALALSLTDQKEQALAALAHANADEEGIRYWFTKARIQEDLGQTNAAYESLSQAITVAQAQSPAQLPAAYLQRSNLLRRQQRLAQANADAGHAMGIPPRDPAAKPWLIDLSAAYAGSLNDLEGPGGMLDGLRDLPTGVQALGGTEWDIRGLVHSRDLSTFGGTPELQGGRFTQASSTIPTIPVNLRCLRLHFLQSASAAISLRAGQFLGKYVVHYADGQNRDIPLRLGQDLCDWYYYPEQPLATEAPMVWVGLGQRAHSDRSFSRLFKMSWTNPSPGVPIQSVAADFHGSILGPVPFLVALTADPAPSEGAASSSPASAAPNLNETIQQSVATLDAAIARNPDYEPLVAAKAVILEQRK